MSHPEPSRNWRRHRMCRFTVPAVLGAAACGALWLVSRPNPAKLVEQGLAAGRRDAAAGERLLRRAIDSAGGHYPDAEMALCVVLANWGAWDAAISNFTGVDKQACRADLLLAFGRAAQTAGRGPQAAEALNAVRQRGTRESVAALELLMAGYREWGLQYELIDAARELTRLEPGNPDHWAQLINLLTEIHSETECLNAAREALRHGGSDTFRREVQHAVVRQLSLVGDTASAWQELRKLEDGEGDSFSVRAFKVDLYRMDGRLDEALETMNTVFPEATERWEACLNRGIIYLDLGRYDEAARDLEVAVGAQPQNALAHFKLSEACRALGRHQAAQRHREIADGINEKLSRIGSLRKQLKRDPQSARIYYSKLAELYRQLGETELANEWEERATRSIARSAES